MSTRDATSFLKDRVSAREAAPKVDRPRQPVSSEEFLQGVTVDRPETSIMQRKLHKRAQLADAADMTRDAREQQEQEQADALAAEEERKNKEAGGLQRVSQVTKNMGQNAGEKVGPLADRVGSLPTVGGVGFLLVILAILLFTVVQVNAQGDTRLKQLWYMLNGRATIKGRVNPASSYIPDTSQI